MISKKKGIPWLPTRLLPVGNYVQSLNQWDKVP